MTKLLATTIAAAMLLGACLPKNPSDFSFEKVKGSLMPGVPGGWVVRGTRYDIEPDHIEVYYDRANARSGKVSACMVSVDAVNKDYATLMEDFLADNYRGKRVRFRGSVKTNGVSGWCGLWMSVDTRQRIGVATDNMEDRPIEGTTAWHEYAVVLDVEEDAVVINIGVSITGRGQVWLDDCSFEVVDDTVPSTNLFLPSRGRFWAIPKRLLDGPLNLDFEEEFL
jgi:hypothetical protein